MSTGERGQMHMLEQLAATAVPPVPPATAFAAGVRRKLHPRLLTLHLVEFACGAMVWSIAHLATALVAAAHFTVTGVWMTTIPAKGLDETDGDSRIDR